MGTRCDLYIKEPDGTFLGAQCFFDGYPEHILRELNYCNFIMLKEYLIVAGSRGGFRIFFPSKGQTEFIGSTPHYIYNPHSLKNDADFIYVVSKDKKLNWKAREDSAWRTECHQKQP